MLIFGVNVVFTIFMIGLCVWDYRSYRSGNHKDFKSIIMSTGVLGTFVGIFMGLLEFDTARLESSVPLLLDGLKTAFYTSILGMGLAIFLAIVQKRVPIKSDEESNLEYLATQAQHLTHLSTLPRIHTRLESTPTTDEIHSLYERNNAMIQSQFSLINHTLEQAVSQLAKGASQELIAALESVIKDFNTNLQDQFGENFKELNSAVAKLLQWQVEYKDFVQESSALLTSTQQSLQHAEQALAHTAQSLQDISAQNAQVQAFYASNLRVIESCELTNQKLESHLKAIAALQSDSQQCLENLGVFFAKAKEGGELAREHISALVHGIETYSQSLSISLQGHLQESAQRLKQSIDSHTSLLATELHAHRESLAQLGDESLSNLKAFNKDMIAQSTQSIESLLKDTAESLQEAFGALTQHITSLSTAFGAQAKESLESLLGQIQRLSQEGAKLHTQSLEDFASLKEHIATQHKNILEGFCTRLLALQQEHQDALNLAMSKDLQAYRASMDSLTQSVQSAKDQGLEFAKNLGANLQSQHQQASKYIKSLALEYLKVLQKVSKESMRLPQESSAQMIAEFGEFQKQIIESMRQTQGDVQHNVAQIHHLYENLGQHMRHTLQDNATLSKDMQDSLRNLDEAMSASVDSFWQNYEWFLERIKDIIGTRR